MRRLIPATVIVLLLLMVSQSPHASNLPLRSAQATSTAEFLVEVLGFDITLDTGAGKMYWTVFALDPGKIQRADLNGDNQELNLLHVHQDDAPPTGLALDLANQKVYWIALKSGKIQRASTSGSGKETLVEGVDSQATGLALDVLEGKVYWTATSQGKIRRANISDLDGRHVDDLMAEGLVEDLVTGLNDPRFIALGLGDEAIYWTERNAGKIRRTSLSGTGLVEDVVTDLTRPYGIALDPVRGRVYWSDFDDNMIRRARLDGSGGVQDVAAVHPQPAGIALDLTGGMVYLVTFGGSSAGWVQRAPLPAETCTC